MYLRTTNSMSLEEASWPQASRKMKVLLIYPPATNAVKSMLVQSDASDEGIGHKPPLGIMYIAATLLAHSNHEVFMLDTQVLNLTEQEILQEIKKINPDVVGITAWTDFWYDTWRVIQIVKNYNPEIHVVLGGPHVGVYPDITLQHSGADFIVLGDGEVPMLLLVNSLSKGEKPNNIPGVHFKEHGVGHGLDKFYIQKDLDALPFPARTLLPYKLYSSVLGKKNYVTTMITSRGCPYQCIFCKLNFQKTLCRSAKNVVDEMEEICRMAIHEIEIYDDTFSWARKRVIEICKGILERKLDVSWAVRDRVSNVTEETLAWMKKAGCQRIHFGIESGSDETLKTVKKKITTEQARIAVAAAKKVGLEVLTYFMLGLPGETEEDMRKTIDFALELDADYTEFSVTVPYAGTEMYEVGLRESLIPHDFWKEYAMKPIPNFVIPHFWEEYLSREELLTMRDFAVNKFYFRPKYIVKQLLKVSSGRELFRKGKMAVNLARETILKKSAHLYDANKSIRIL